MKLVYPREEDLSGNILEKYSPDGYSRVYIVDKEGALCYVLEDPKVSDSELSYVRDIIENKLIYIVKPSDVENEESFKKLLKRVGVADDKLVYLIVREVVGYKILHPLIMDEHLEDILCTRAGLPLIVLHQDYGRLTTNIVLSEKEVDDLVRMLAYKGGKTISRFLAKLDSVILPTGDRARLAYRSEVSATSNFTIRKFPRRPWTPPRILATRMITADAMAWLWLAVEYKMPVVMFGEMGSGKTSLQNALGMLIKPDSSVAVVADCPELKLPHPIKYEFYARQPETLEKLGEITLEDLIAHALRASVDYVLVNEVRFKEARAFAQAVATGHGGLTTFHASDVAALFGRLKDLGVEESIAESLKLFVHCATLVEKKSRPLRKRRVKGIYFLRRLSDWKPEVEPLYVYRPEEDVLESRVENSIFLEELARVSYMSSEELLEEHSARKRFLELVTRAREKAVEKTPLVDSPSFWFDLLKRFYSEREKVLAKLESLAGEEPRRKQRIVVEVSEE
ncbi:MAG: hypothetical protein DRN04_15940, partial [Thermoprotei archaeon]